MHRRGQARPRRAAASVLVTTGTLRLPHLRRQRPRATRSPWTHSSRPRSSGENGYWQDEDMVIDTRRKLIIGALDPRHDDVDQTSCPGIGTLARRTAIPSCRSGFYVISYADPAQPAPDRRLRRTARRATRRAASTTATTSGPAARRGATTCRRSTRACGPRSPPGGRGDGRPIWVTDLRNPAKPKVFTKPIDLWRNDGATDYSHDVQVDDAGLRLGQRPRRHPRLRHQRPLARPVHGPLAPGAAVGPGARGRRRRRPASTSRQTDFMHNSMRPLDGSTRADGRPQRQRADRHRGGLHRAAATPAGGSSCRTSPTRSAASRRRTRRPRARTG